MREAVRAGARVFERSPVTADRVAARRRRGSRSPRPHRRRRRRGAAGGDRDRLRDAPVPAARRPLPARAHLRRGDAAARRADASARSASPTSCCGTRGARTTTRAGPPTIACCSAAPIARSAAAASRRRVCRPPWPEIRAPLRDAAPGARRRRDRARLGRAFREHAGQPALRRPAPPVSGPRLRARLRRQRHDVRLAGRPPAGRAMAGRQVEGPRPVYFPSLARRLRSATAPFQ